MATSIWNQILTAAGIAPSNAATEFLALWSQGEGGLTEYRTPGDASSGSIYNPFNITYAYGQKTVGQGGAQGDIQYFANEAAGVAASAAWLKQEAYLAPVREALASGNMNKMYQAVNSVRTTLGGSTVSADYPPLAHAYLTGTGPAASGVYATGNPPPPPDSTSTPNSTANASSSVADDNTAAGIAGADVSSSVTPITGGPLVNLTGWDITGLPTDRQAEARQFLGTVTQATMNSFIQTFNSDYPQYSFLLQIPQLKTILVFGSLSGMTPDGVMGMIRTTSWWQTTSVNARYYQELKGTDPATALSAVMSGQAAVARTAATLGVNLSAQQISNLGLKVAENSMGSTGTIPDTGYTQDQITRAVVNEADIAKQGVGTGGDVSTLADNFQKLAGQYMYNLTTPELDNWVQRSIQGDYNQSGFTTGASSAFEQFLKQQAVKEYPWMKEQIAEGVTPNQIIAPYASAASSILEIAPTVAQTELTGNGKFAFALGQKNPKTQMQEPMSVADFRQELMSNPKYGYQYTNQAQQSAWTTGAELLRSFGAIAGSVT